MRTALYMQAPFQTPVAGSLNGGANGGSEERFFRAMSSSKAGEGLEKEGCCTGGSKEGRAEKSTGRFENEVEGALAGCAAPLLNPDAKC